MTFDDIFGSVISACTDVVVVVCVFGIYVFRAPDKAAYCVFTQFRGPENAIKFISVRTKTQ